MMKSLLLAVAILLGISVDNAAAQSRFVPDSISIEYAQCKGDSALAEVLLINRGSSLEILDLRFADSNRTWEIYDSLGGVSYIKGAMLFGGDTLALKVRQKPQFAGLTHEWYRDTLVTSGGATSDTLLLNARIQFADLGTDLDSVDFGVMPQGAVVAQIFRVWNSGDAPHIFYVTHSLEWRLDGIANGDTLLPGDTVEAHFVLPGTAPLGTYNPFIAIGGDCDDLGIFRGVRVKIAPQAAHWTAISLIDSSTGCPSGEDYQVTIRNDAQTISFIDSIQILDQASQWSFPPPNNNSFGLQPFTEKTIVLRRGVSGTSTRLVIHSQSTAPDTLQVTFVPMFSRPRIKNSVDTIRLSLKPNEADDQKIEIQNLGTGLYHISDVQLFGDPRWSVLGLDTITTIGQSKSLFITLVFSGAAADGDYPVQAFIRGLPCDTLLTQVVVSQVRSLDVAERDAIDAVMVYPTSASNSVTMRSSSKVSYHLYDLLGKEIFGGVAASGDTMLDVSMLPIGRYFLRLESNGSQRTVPITIQR